MAECVTGQKRIEQIIILSMIYAYCLSLFSVHFFSNHNIANFKLRLINQQTADCTDSIILHANKLTSQILPVPIKLKGGEHLLVKVKLLSLPSNSTEVLIGQGVISFDKNTIDRTLRVPIYDKQRGVEEVAICSIDFFLSGFEVDKHVSIIADKSKSRVEDFRDRTEEAVYSQMSYTLESERESLKSSQVREEVKPIPAIVIKNPKIKAQVLTNSNKKVETKGKEQNDEQMGKKENGLSPRSHLQFNFKDDDEPQPRLEIKKLNNQSSLQPFTLENNVYLQEPIHKKAEIGSQSKHLPLKDTKKIYSSRVKTKYMVESEQEAPRVNNKDMSPENLRETVKENELVLSRLKKYISFIEKQESPKHKRRRKKIKVEEFTAYSSQNNFVKYHVDQQSFSKCLKNLKAIRVIQNHIKQPNQEKIICQTISRVSLSSLNGVGLVTFDANGFRAYCQSSGQSESVVTIFIPTNQNAIKINLVLQEEGEFQGVIGLQEGQQMAVTLNKLNQVSEQSVLERSEFKFLFDIKSPDSKPQPKALDNNPVHQNEMSFRQPYSIMAPGQDIKARIGQLSCQPWGFVKSYAEGAIVSAKSKEMMNKIEEQLPKIRQQAVQPRLLHRIKTDTEVNTEITMKKVRQKSAKPRSISRQYLQSSFRKVKPVPSQLRRETDSINSIRNGNRNNYRFKEHSSKQMKEAWEQILFKRNLEAQRRKMETEKQIKKSLRRNLNISRQSESIRKNSINSSNTESENDSLSSPKSKKTNKIYQFVVQDRKIPLHPVRTFTLKITNFSITQPQSMIDQTKDIPVGKFAKFGINNKVIYFTEVIFNGGYNSILWRLQGCVFSELTGVEKLKVQIFETLNNRVTTLGASEIRVNRLFFLRKNHIYNGTIMQDHTLFGEFTLGFQIEEYCPFQIIHEEEEDTLNFANHHHAETKRLRTLSHQSQKQLQRQSKNLQSKAKNLLWEQENEDSLEGRVEIEQSMSMPIGLNEQ